MIMAAHRELNTRCATKKLLKLTYVQKDQQHTEHCSESDTMMYRKDLP